MPRCGIARTGLGAFIARSLLEATVAPLPEALLRAEGMPAARSRGILRPGAGGACRRAWRPPAARWRAWSIALPWRGADGWRGALAPVPALGEANGQVLGGLLGLDAPRLAALAEGGAMR